jgi:hypothetical protein
MALILRPPGEAPAFVARLAALGRWHGVATGVRGFATLATWCAICVLMSAGLDLAFTLPAALRSLMLGVALGGIIFLAVKLLRSHRLSAQTMALRIEARNRDFKNALRSAAAFGDDPHPFRQATRARAENVAEAVPPVGVVPISAMLITMLLALAAMAAAVTLLAVNSRLIPTLAARWADPFGDHNWPARTRIDSLHFPATIAAGEPFTLSAEISGAMADEATVKVQIPYAAHSQDTFKLDAIDDEHAVLKATLDAARLSGDFQFQLHAGDAVSAWHAVRVVPPPKLVPLEGHASPRIHLTFPAYTALSAVHLPDGATAVEAVTGTRVVLKAHTDRPLRKAWLECREDLRDHHLAAAVAPLAGFTAALTPLFTTPIPVTISGRDRRTLVADFHIPVNGLWALQMTDDDGVSGKHLLDLRSFTDPAPIVTMLQPDATHEGVVRLDGAVPIAGQALDRIYAPAELHLEYSFNNGPWLSRSLQSQPSPRGQGLRSQYSIAIATLRHADGRPAISGDVLSVRLAATDHDNVSILKQPGRSATVALTVHSLESLQAEMDRRIAALRQPLNKAAAAQKQAWEETTKPDAVKTADAVATAQAAARSLVNDPRDGMQAKVRKLQQAARDHALPKTAGTARLDAVSRALDRIEGKQFPQMEDDLAALRNKPGDAAALAKLAARQQAALKEFAAAERELERWAGVAELRGDLDSLRGEAARLGRDTAAMVPQIPAGAAPAELNAADRAALNAQATRAAAAADALEKFTEKARAVQDARGTDAGPDSKALKTAFEKNDLAEAVDELRKASRALKENRLQNAARALSDAEARLQDVAKSMTPAPASPEELSKVQRSARETIQDLKASHEALTRRKPSAADPMAQKRVDDELETLRRRIESGAEQLERAGKPEAAEELRRAAEAMERHSEVATEAEKAEAERDAQKALAQAEKKAEPPQHGLDREKAEDITKLLKAMAERQGTAVAEFERITQAALKAQAWERPLLASLASLADQETSLASEVKSLAEAKLAESPVFQKLLEQAGARMIRAAAKLKDRKDDALAADAVTSASEATANAVALKPMTDALQRLQSLVRAIEPSKDKSTEAKPPDAKPGEPPPTEGAPKAPSTGVSALAQLKALAEWQGEVNAATAQFARKNPDATKLTDDARSELDDLRRQQQTIAELFAKLKDQLQPLAEDLP